jgi:malic enzyme
LSAAEALADIVQESDLAVGRLYPPLSEIRNVSIKIAASVAEEAYKLGSASMYPEPADKVLNVLDLLDVLVVLDVLNWLDVLDESDV